MTGWGGDDGEWTIHPGAAWLEVIEESGLPAPVVAERGGITHRRLLLILAAHAEPTAHETVGFCEALNLPLDLFWQMGCHYQLALALGARDLTFEVTPPTQPERQR